MDCKICGGKTEAILEASERMFNMGGKFSYGLCQDCGSLNLLTPIESIDKFYPQEYYSYSFDYSNPKPNMKLTPGIEQLIKSLKLTENSSVLDWGAGSVSFVYTLSEMGVGIANESVNLRAYDPYCVPNKTPKGIKIQDTIPTDTTFDVITFLHSLEHTEYPIEELKKALTLLKDGGHLIIATPNVKSMAFTRFLKNWVQLDAPRHRVILTTDTSYILAEMFNLEVVSIACDGTHFGIAISEALESGMTFKAAEDALRKEAETGDKKGEILRYNSAANYLNSINYGDQFTVIFKKRLKQ